MATATPCIIVQPAGSTAGTAIAMLIDPAPGVIVESTFKPAFAPGESTMPVRSIPSRNMVKLRLTHRLRSVMTWFCAAAFHGAWKSEGDTRQEFDNQAKTLRVSVWSALCGLAGRTYRRT